VESTNQPYLLPEVQSSQRELSDGRFAARGGAGERELTRGRVLLHLLLLSVTAVTTTLTGAAWRVPPAPESASVSDALFHPILTVFQQTASGNFGLLTAGLLFTFALLTILGAHELGHYFACRHYGIRATLPFFIPAPPAITPFGTFGAVIKIKEPITTRRALFDIGIAGPLAGFAFALPAAVVGLLVAEPSAPPDPSSHPMVYYDPLLFKIIMGVFGLPQWIDWNPIYWAAWGALLVTSINLFPVGQLDGGHVVYAALGGRAHKWVSRLTCLAVAAIASVSLLFYYSPVWVVWLFVLLFLLKVGHPPVDEMEPLGRARTWLAVVALLVFILSFLPVPIGVM
jgi:membrane-associated protease RseP (regulator of RpoE activity)